MKTWLQRRVVWHLLFWTVVSGFSMLMCVPAHVFAGEPMPWHFYFASRLPLFLLGTYSLLYGLLPRLLRTQPGPIPMLLLAGWVLGSMLASNLMELLYDFVVAPHFFGNCRTGHSSGLKLPKGCAWDFSRCCLSPASPVRLRYMTAGTNSSSSGSTCCSSSCKSSCSC